MIDEGRVEHLAKLVHELQGSNYDVPWERVSAKYRRQEMEKVRRVLVAINVSAKRTAATAITNNKEPAG